MRICTPNLNSSSYFFSQNTFENNTNFQSLFNVESDGLHRIKYDSDKTEGVSDILDTSKQKKKKCPWRNIDN